MSSLKRALHSAYTWAHPDRPGGPSGVFYAVLCGILMLALAGQQLGVIHSADLLGTSHPVPGVVSGRPPADGGKKPFAAPVRSVRPQIVTPATVVNNWYVRPFYTRDTGVNISPIINAAGDHYNIWPVYILAVVFAESGGYDRSERWAAWPDQSCGLMQQIILNVWSKIGQTTPRAACDWEEVAANSIWYGTSILRDYMNRTGVGYPALWECYNAGPGSCQSPYYQTFLQNYYVALTYAANDPPPKPKPFPKKAWCSYRVSKGKPCFPFKDGRGRLTWPASIFHAHQSIGSPVNRGHWFGRKQGFRLGFDKYGYRFSVVYAWPRSHTYKIVPRRHPRMSVAPQSVTSCDTVHTGCAGALLRVINADRARHGAPPLALSWTQSHCSKKHSVHMAAEGFISHDQFPADVCIPYTTGAGENVGQYGMTSEWSDLVGINNLMLSEPWSPGCTGNHACNLRSTQYTTIGIGIYYTTSGAWLTEDFTG